MNQFDAGWKDVINLASIVVNYKYALYTFLHFGLGGEE